MGWHGRARPLLVRAHLVERVEGFADAAEWQRAPAQIVQFDAGLAAEGMVLVKIWLHVSEKEQLQRFRARESDPLKRWKLTGEDWRNVSHRAGYEEAAADMLSSTDHPAAPWHVISAESKHYARVAVLELVISAIEDALRALGRDPVAGGAQL
jgi:AMP-polyphosphate phosphotransferase